MFDPVGEVWRRAGQGSLPPGAFIRRWGVKKIGSLIAELLSHDAKRRKRLRQFGSGRAARVCESGSATSTLPRAFTKVCFRGDPPEGGWPVRFVVITAYNPEARIVTPAENNAADRSLRNKLRRDTIFAFRVTGGSRDRRHMEPGWGFVPPVDGYAAGLCRQFHQLAYFEVTDGAVLLVNALDESCRHIGSWSDLLIAPVL